MSDVTLNMALQVWAAGVAFSFFAVLFIGLLFDVLRTVRRGVLG